MTVIRPTNPQTDSPPSVTAPEVTEKSGFDHRRWAPLVVWSNQEASRIRERRCASRRPTRPSTPAFTNHYRGMGVVGFANENARKHFNTLSGEEFGNRTVRPQTFADPSRRAVTPYEVIADLREALAQHVLFGRSTTLAQRQWRRCERWY